METINRIMKTKNAQLFASRKRLLNFVTVAVLV